MHASFSSAALLAAFAACAIASPARAEDAAPAPAAAPAAPVPSGPLADVKLQKLLPESEKRIALYGWLEVGGTYNPEAPTNSLNFGRAFDDRSNEVMPNQLALNVERALAPEKGQFDWGFKVQGIYGSDARYTRSLGLGDKYGKDEAQLDLIEANLQLHLPALTEGGLDLKLGKFSTLCAYEVIDPRGNFFYSHNYIFNFGPFDHFGGLATLHATENLDVCAGVVRGVNISLEDNNDAASFHGSVALNNILGGKVSTVAALCAGPETPNDNSDMRWFGTWVTTVKVTDKLNSATEAAYYEDRVGGAKAYGVSQTLTYAINDQWSIGARGEIFRDEQGFFVAGFTDNADPARVLRGDAPVGFVGNSGTTYGAITVGANYKPCDGITLRPEIRYDSSLTGVKAFDAGNNTDQWTFAMDVIWTF